MAITLKDPELEERLQKLGERQSVPVTKHRMLRAIVEEATKDLRKPNAWRSRDAKTSREGGDTTVAA